MKKTILKTTLAIAMFGSTTLQARETSPINISINENLITTTFGVRGNCGMCKATIEKAALSIKGVSKANWDSETKVISVTYDSKKVNLDQIHYAIAQSGYDTGKIKTSSKSYDKLPGCCQYDRNMPLPEEKTTKIQTKTKEHNHNNHNH